MNEQQLANTIINQIQSADIWALGAYAAQDFIVLGTTDEYIGGLQFSCNGFNVKGKVTIQLHWNDTYTISFYNRNNNLMKTVEGVYCDQLVEVLDFIELQNEEQENGMEIEVSLN
jgi:hypothetical protein